MVEQLIRNHQVSGSTPLGGSSIFKDLQSNCKSLLFPCLHMNSQGRSTHSSGRSSVWKSIGFGSRGSEVQILSPRPFISRRERAKATIISKIAAYLLKLCFCTCKIHVINPQQHQRYVEGKESIIGAIWHRGSIFFVYYYGTCRPTLLFSRSRDGEYLARFAEQMGSTVVRGSSSKGGMAALHEMIIRLKNSGGKFGSVLDGPRGPRFIAKPGTIMLAKKTGVPILPVTWSATKVYTFKKSWDRTMVPLPFSHIWIAYGEIIYVPAEGGKELIKEYTGLVESELNRLTRHVDWLCGYEG
jgi:lysophospholipid acyltransferase (LPLAT)-like uncharacterized protein